MINTEYKRVRKNPVAVARGKASAEKRGHAEMVECASEGGRIRALRLTPRQRKEIAQMAIAARWAKAREKAAELERIEQLAKKMYGNPYKDI
jgi:hypothetical protein